MTTENAKTYETLAQQAVDGLEISRAGGLVKVDDGQDTWLCEEGAWDAAVTQLESRSAHEEDEGSAYSELCSAVRSPIASTIGSSKGDARALVARALRAGLIDDTYALAQQYEDEYVELGRDNVQAVAVDDGYAAYYAAETRRWYVVDDSDMADLGRRIAADEQDAYSRWCADTAASDFGVGDRVAGGEGEDRESGEIVSIEEGIPTVAWDGGSTTPACLADLSHTTERHSGGHRMA